MRELKLGDRGDEVRFLQNRLTLQGLHLKIDGDFGKKTEDAVIQIQAQGNLKTDGVVGDKTWDYLMGQRGADAVPSEILSLEKRRLMNEAVGQGHDNNLVEACLNIAIAQLGLAEDPLGSNGGKQIAHIVDEGGDGLPPSAYYKHWRVGGDPLQHMPPWCAIFVSWALKEGLKKSWKEIPFGDWYGGARQIEDWAAKQSRFIDNEPMIRPGSIFTMSREGSGSDAHGSTRAGHVGFVVADKGSEVITIEGNVSNKVSTRKRKKETIRHFIKWW